MIRLDEHTSCLLDEQAARLRQADPARRPLDEWQSHLGLEAADLLGQRGLSDPEPLGSTREMRLLGHHDEVSQVAEFHNASL